MRPTIYPLNKKLILFIAFYLMFIMCIYNIMSKRTSSKIYDESNIIDVLKSIFIAHYGECFIDRNKNFQPNPLAVTGHNYSEPHLVKHNGDLIYLQLSYRNNILNQTSDELIMSTLTILNIKIGTKYTVTIDPRLELDELFTKKINVYDVYVLFDEHNIHNKFLEIDFVSNETDKISTKMKTDKTNLDPITETIFSRDKWISASKTRNYALQETLIDWLDLWYKNSIETDNFSSRYNTKSNDTTDTSTENDFSKFIMNKGTQFEKNVYALLKKKFTEVELVSVCTDLRNYDKKVFDYEKTTIEHIKNGIPLIYQGLLMNRSGPLVYTYGIPDLIVRSDYLDKIVKLQPYEKDFVKFKAPYLNGNYHYVIVDIKFTTLELCSDGKRIRNAGSVPAYKCQLYIYTHALGLIQGFEPTKAFIIGRKFKYESCNKQYYGNECFARYGHIEYDDWDRDYIQETIAAVEWLKKLKTEGKNWKLLPLPSVPELYPNMASTYDSPWDSFKYEYASKIGEITLLWNCGVKNRKIAHSKGIYSYRDTKCNAKIIGISGVKQAPILDKIIKINQKSQFASNQEKITVSIDAAAKNPWSLPSKLRITVDFETINCIFDNFQNLPAAQNNTYLFMIGVGYKVTNNDAQYKMFLVSELSKDAEFQIIYQFYKFLRKITDEYVGPNEPIPELYHWGHIERSFFSGLCERLQKAIGTDINNDLSLMKNELKWCDMADSLKNNHIVINGCFKFGLKEVAGRLSELGLIKSRWNNQSACSNGNTAMIIAYRAYQQAKQLNKPITAIPIMREIMDYNKIDCLVIHEIIDLLNTLKN